MFEYNTIDCKVRTSPNENVNYNINKDWQRSCADLHKHCPTTNELDARLNILMELM